MKPADRAAPDDERRIRRCISVSVGTSVLSAATLTAFALSIGVPTVAATRDLPP